MTIVSGWRPEGQEYDEFMSGPKTGRFRMCKICGGMHSTAKWPDNCRPETPWLRSDLPSPMIISDTLPGNINGMVSMHDLKRYDSKSAYYRSLREGGCEIIGNERPKPKQGPSDRVIEADVEADVKDAIEQLTTNGLSNDEMTNMLRAPVESKGGFNVQ